MKRRNWVLLIVLMTGGLAMLSPAFRAAAVGTCNIVASSLQITDGVVLGSGQNNTTNIFGKPLTLQGLATNGSDVINGMNVNGVLNVKTFGAKGDGVTDDAPAINAAAAQARSLNANPCVYLPAGVYKVNSDLNFTSSTARPFCLYGDSTWNTHILCQDNGGNCVDASGSDAYLIHDLMIDGTSASNVPKVGLLSARTTGAAVGYGYQLTNVIVANNGAYGWYNFGGELAHTTGSRFNGAVAGVVFSATNSPGIHSSFQTLIPITAPTGTPGFVGYGTSMSAIYMINSVIGVQNGSTGVLFDTQPLAPPTGGWQYFIAIHDIFMYGTYFGECSGGGTALGTTSTTPANGGSLLNILVDGARMEAVDTASTNYAFANLAGNGVTNMTIRNALMGLSGPTNVPMLSFSVVDGSYIDVSSNIGPTTGMYIVATGGHQSRFFNVPKAYISPILSGGTSSPNIAATEQYANSFSWQDNAGVSHVDNAGYEANNGIQIAGTTGNLTWSQGIHSLHNKMAVFTFANWTGGAQTLTYPYTFLATPTLIGTCPAGMTSTNGANIAVPAIAVSFSGQCAVVGM